MFSSLTSAVFMIDAVPDHIPPILELQQALMERFFHNVKQRTMRALSGGVPLVSICDWDNTIRPRYDSEYETPPEDQISKMECADGILQTFTLTGRFVRYEIEYLPNTVEKVEITSANFRYAVNTRQFPVRSRKVNLRNNRINGSIDLSTLPPYLEWFNIRLNHISGTITLTNLPRGLTHLCLSYNKIDQRTVYYADLPLGFHASLGKNKIFGARALWSDQKAPKGTFDFR